MADLFEVCWVTLWVLIATEHFVAYSRVRSFNMGVWLVLAFAAVNWIGDLIFVEYKAGREVDRKQFPDIMGEPKFWLVGIVTTFVCMVPLYA